MKVLVVDDHTLVRNGIVSLLTANNVEVVGEANNGADALLKARQLKPDMVLMDIKMPGTTTNVPRAKWKVRRWVYLWNDLCAGKVEIDGLSVEQLQGLASMNYVSKEAKACKRDRAALIRLNRKLVRYMTTV